MIRATSEVSTATTDVVVVGFGAAGTSAAITAREQGAEVIALDRANGGGATAISGGIIYAGAGTSVQRQAGVADTVDQMLAYLRLEVGDAVSPQTLERFVRTSPEMIDWLQRHGVPFDASLCPYKTSFPNNRYYLYHSGSENAGAFSSRTPPVQRGHRVKGKGTSGKQLYAPLARSARALGVDFRPHTKVTALLQDSSGRVTGVEARTMQHAPRHIRRAYAAMAALSTKPGVYYPPLRQAMDRRLAALERRYARPVRIVARQGVIVCAGGFIANTDWRERHAPDFVHGLPLGTSGDDGSGIALAQDMGAVTAHMDNVSAWRFITPPSAFLSSIVVDDKGQRIIDESRYGAALGRAMVTNHGGKGWILADANLMAQAKRQLLTQTLWFQRAQAAALMFADAVHGPTLADVARAAGVDPEGLAATVKAHNAAIDSGTTDPVGKPAHFCRRIERGPFTLMNISVRPKLLCPTPMLTLGGVRVAEDTGAVLNAAGDPIPGLFGAGRTAVGVCSESYVSGLSIADCVFSGRRAGASAATG
ncbi:FAD-binding protein [Mycobacterium talmoniae]|uniref:23S rRNA methyltransferase n=2 Tax=Mycobacterium talmoniae TaxID=1858794 RepID=A0A1S1NNK4_9MYCO|nr:MULTISPECIES: FAD-binding protein [Mycobacterium]OHV06448.1 23S rRNA methyltransferase [Mycobacterium talmoniae]TDH57398.1 FAD-binding protein [Mycobacterium eburneum]